MATNLKTSKKIRAFIYRIIGIGAFLTFIASSLMGRDAINNWYRVGDKTLSGEVYYLMEFREYISFLYTQGMLYYAGVGDDNGYPLTDESASNVSSQAYKNFKNILRETDGDILYYIRTNNTENSNIYYPIFSEYDGHLMLPENTRLCCYWDGEKLSFFSGGSSRLDFYRQENSYDALRYNPVSSNAKHMDFLIAIETDKEFTSSQMQEWEDRAIWYRNILIVIISSAILALLGGLLSLFSTKAAKACKSDYALLAAKCSLEIKLLLLIGCLFLLYINGLLSFNEPLTALVSAGSMWLYLPTGALLYLLWTDLSFNGIDFWLNSIPVKVYNYIREYSRSLPWQRKALTMYSASLTGAIINILLGLFIPAAELYLTGYLSITSILPALILFMVTGLFLLPASLRLRRFIKDIEAVAGKISELQQGQITPPLLLSKASLLKHTADSLNELEQGIDNAVEQRNRSNKMRVELITNVSHDLKTPLTSIINYADLLCEEPLEAPALDYARALREKAYRLKNMVQDVFDLSKATTGNLPVEKHRLDLAKLIRQTLADMDEKISESTLTFKLTIATEPIMIEADGDKLYRVFQNLFVNALQYSLDYSRVHIQLTTQDDYAVAKIKNTSKSELNFDTAEITERFVRADTSRSTEGSGLGLSIVQSFTETCGGTFTIDTDADMFIACVRFPLSQEVPTCEAEECDSTEKAN